MEDVAPADIIPFDQPGFSLPLARFASTGHIYPIQPAKPAKVISKAPVVGGVSTPHTGPLEQFPTGPTDTLVMLALLGYSGVPIPELLVPETVVFERPEIYVYEDYFAVSDSKPASPCSPSHSCSLDTFPREGLVLKPTAPSTSTLDSESS